MIVLVEVAYTGLVIGHLGVLTLLSVAMFDISMIPTKLNQLSLSMITLVFLLTSEFMVILPEVYTPSKKYSAQSVRSMIEIMDGLAVFTFTGIFVNVSNVKVSSLFRGLASTFHKTLMYGIITKIILSVTVFFLGLAFCYLSTQSYIPIFTSLYYCVLSSGNSFVLILSQFKVSNLKILQKSSVPVASSHSSKVNPQSSNDNNDPTLTVSGKNHNPGMIIPISSNSKKMLSTPSNDGSFTAQSEASKVESAMVEIKAILFGGVYIHVFAIIATIIVDAIFRERTEHYGLIISIPWKVSLGLGICIMPYTHLRAMRTARVNRFIPESSLRS